MSYISEIRKLVGSEPIILVGATIIVLNKKGEILLNKRSDTDTWGIPGGSMELGEELKGFMIQYLWDSLLIDILSMNNIYMYEKERA